MADLVPSTVGGDEFLDWDGLDGYTSGPTSVMSLSSPFPPPPNPITATTTTSNNFNNNNNNSNDALQSGSLGSAFTVGMSAVSPDDSARSFPDHDETDDSTNFSHTASGVSGVGGALRRAAESYRAADPSSKVYRPRDREKAKEKWRALSARAAEGEAALAREKKLQEENEALRKSVQALEAVVGRMNQSLKAQNAELETLRDALAGAGSRAAVAVAPAPPPAQSRPPSLPQASRSLPPLPANVFLDKENELDECARRVYAGLVAQLPLEQLLPTIGRASELSAELFGEVPNPEYAEREYFAEVRRIAVLTPTQMAQVANLAAVYKARLNEFHTARCELVEGSRLALAGPEFSPDTTPPATALHAGRLIQCVAAQLSANDRADSVQRRIFSKAFLRTVPPLHAIQLITMCLGSFS